MAENGASWLRLATRRFAPTGVPLPQAPAPTTLPAPVPPRILTPASMQPRRPTSTPAPVQPPSSAPPPAPTNTPARAPSPIPAPARAPSPTPAVAPVKPQPPARQISQQTAAPPAFRTAPPPPTTTITLPKTQPPSPSPPQRQAVQPAPSSPESRTSMPAVAPFQASKSQPASPSPPPQSKGSPPPTPPQSPETAHPPSPPAPPSPSSMHKPKQVVTETVKNQVNPTASTDVKPVDKVVLVKNVPPSSRVAAITDSGKGNHTPPQHSKVHEEDGVVTVVPVETVPSSRAAAATASEVGNQSKPQHAKIHGDGNSGAGLHKNRIFAVRDDEDQGMRIISISGENNGATMEIIAGDRLAHNVGNGVDKHKKEAENVATAKEGESTKKEPGHRRKPVSAIVNSNVQSVNNSIMYGCNFSHNSPEFAWVSWASLLCPGHGAAPTTKALAARTK